MPHKKRISRKLKKPCNKKYNCNLCEQTFHTIEDFNVHQTLCQTTITPINITATFSCQLCSSRFNDQLQFFGHLKNHYEPQTSQANQSTTNVYEDFF